MTGFVILGRFSFLLLLSPPYASNYDNPIRYSDPLDDEGQDCCGPLDILKGLITFGAGAVNAWSSNQIGGAGRVDVNEMHGLSFGEKVIAKAGQAFGDAGTIVTGSAEVVAGTGAAVTTGGIAAPVGVAVGIHGVTAVSLGFTNLIKGLTTPIVDDRVNSSSTTKQNGKLTEPTLPDKKIGASGEVEVVHYTKSGDHGPPHVHVKGGGKETKVGQNGKPIKGSPELTPEQRAAIQVLKAEIRKGVKQIMKWFDYNNK